MNKVPRKKGYVPNMYTGRSMMMYGGDHRMMKGHGGKASSDIYAMETACNKMAGYNMSLPKGR